MQILVILGIFLNFKNKSKSSVGSKMRVYFVKKQYEGD